MEHVPPSTPAPRAVRLGPFVPDPRPDPREVMAYVERMARELAADAPRSAPPMTLRGSALERALNGVPTSPNPPVSGIVPIHH